MGDAPSGVRAGVITGVTAAESMKLTLSRRDPGVEPDIDGRAEVSKYLRLGRSASNDSLMLGGLLWTERLPSVRPRDVCNSRLVLDS